MSQVKTWTREIQVQGELIARFKQAGLIWEGENERKYGKIEKRIGECKSCQGDVMFYSRFILLSGSILPGIPPMQEEKTCFCRDCGIVYSESYLPLQETILKLREG